MGSDLIRQLEDKAKKIRRSIIRMLGEAGSGHPGGSLSAADIVTALYFYVLHIRPEEPSWPERDRLFCQRTCRTVLYAALAERGFSQGRALDIKKLGSRLQGHPDMTKLPGVEMSTGSLGQGLSVANGWPWPVNWTGKDTGFMCFWVTGKCRKEWFGRRPWLLPITGWII